jgi:hypothetical protein
MTDPRKGVCCLCGNGGTWDELFGIAVFPMEDVDSAQQWFVHPKCLWDAMVQEVRESAALGELTDMGFRDG